MKITQIQYTVKESFVAQNKENISGVMAAVRELNPKELKYSSFVKGDGKTFIHLVIGSEESTKIITGLKAFHKFQRDLNESGFEIPPALSELSLVGASWDII